MRKIKIGLILLFLVSIASCCKPVKEIEYVDRLVYEKPMVDSPVDTKYPELDVVINGDLVLYREMCKAQIDKCNVDKVTIYKQSQGIK